MKPLKSPQHYTTEKIIIIWPSAYKMSVIAPKFYYVILISLIKPKKKNITQIL